jgi:2-amino-4-hydroxy-6-hydroxymethyldihydropteridine diphosphokinase
VSPIPQPEYLNTVALGFSALPAEDLLAGALAVEVELGRRRDGRRDAPRTIDIDLLFVGAEVSPGPGLELPHPRLRERRFVLAPLADLAPELPLPPDGASPRALLARLPERPWARRLEPGAGR